MLYHIFVKFINQHYTCPKPNNILVHSFVWNKFIHKKRLSGSKLTWSQFERHDIKREKRPSPQPVPSRHGVDLSPRTITTPHTLSLERSTLCAYQIVIRGRAWRDRGQNVVVTSKEDSGGQDTASAPIAAPLLPSRCGARRQRPPSPWQRSGRSTSSSAIQKQK